MAMVDIKVIIVASKDDLNDGWSCAGGNQEVLTTSGYSVRLINKLGYVLEDLLFVGQQRVMSTPTTLVFSDEKLIGRASKLLTRREIEEMLK